MIESVSIKICVRESSDQRQRVTPGVPGPAGAVRLGGRRCLGRCESSDGPIGRRRLLQVQLLPLQPLQEGGPQVLLYQLPIRRLDLPQRLQL